MQLCVCVHGIYVHVLIKRNTCTCTCESALIYLFLFTPPSLAQVGIGQLSKTVGTYVDSQWDCAQFALPSEIPSLCFFTLDTKSVIGKPINISRYYMKYQIGLACTCTCISFYIISFLVIYFFFFSNTLAICQDGSFYKYNFTPEGTCIRDTYDVFLDIGDSDL